MAASQPHSYDDDGLPPAAARARLAPSVAAEGAGNGEVVTFMAIAVALLAIAIVVFVSGVHDLVVAPASEPFAATITRAFNSALFIVVELEPLRTIISRLEGGGFQLQPFLVIGIISATRDILTIGAELSLGQVPVTRTMVELAVNAGVVVALAVALVLVRRFARLERA